MKKCAIFLTLLASSSFAVAEWKSLASNAQADIFYEPSSLRKSKSLARAWTMAQFSPPILQNGAYVGSVKGLIEIDCTKENARMLASIFYFDKTGMGSVAFSDNEPKPWRPIAPETLNSRLHDVLCNVIAAP